MPLRALAPGCLRQVAAQLCNPILVPPRWTSGGHEVYPHPHNLSYKNKFMKLLSLSAKTAKQVIKHPNIFVQIFIVFKPFEKNAKTSNEITIF